MSMYNNLLALKTQVENDLPGLLATAGLTALDEYVLGSPTDSELLSLGFYLGVGDETPERMNFKPVMQVQLPGVQYTEGLKYFDVLFDFLDGMDESLIGMLSKNRISFTEFPADETATTIFTFYGDYFNEYDDCKND